MLLEAATEHALGQAILLRVVRRDELLLPVIAFNSVVKWRLVNNKPLSERSKNGPVTLASAPNLPIKTCSKALVAMLALPERHRCQPSNSRL